MEPAGRRFRASGLASTLTHHETYFVFWQVLVINPHNNNDNHNNNDSNTNNNNDNSNNKNHTTNENKYK